MNRADATEAETDLRACIRDLQPVSEEAARSLEEGLDEVLTLHRLGVSRALGQHLRTTNGIESLNAHVEKRLAKIKRYVSSTQRRQWAAMALLDAEGRFQRLSGYRALPLLRQALHRHIDRLTDELTATG